MKRVRKFKGGGMDAAKDDFKTPSSNPFSAGHSLFSNFIFSKSNCSSI